jgi:hypothetical protein
MWVPNYEYEERGERRISYLIGKRDAIDLCKNLSFNHITLQLSNIDSGFKFYVYISIPT